MLWIDWVLLGVIGLSALISLVRGFVREVISVVVWGLAFWIGVRYAGVLGGFMEGLIESPTIRLGAAFAALFVLTLIVGALTNNALSALVGKTGLTGTDRALGVLFGAGRGVVIVALLVLLLGFTPVTSEQWWDRSWVIDGTAPWVCRAGAGEWLQDIGLPGSLPASGAGEGIEGAPEYWVSYCDEAGS